MAGSLTFCRLSRHPVVVEGRNYYHPNRLDTTSRMMVVSSFYHHFYRDNQQNVYKIAASLTFCRLSRYPVVIEGQNHHHSICRIETVQMVVVLSFNYKWISR